MKNIYLFIAIAFSAYIHAQIPNSGFESWTDDIIINKEDFPNSK